jgi:chromosome segregation ATPase
VDWIKKNWLVIVIGVLLVAALSAGIPLGLKARRVERAFDKARERIANLEETVERADATVGELESELERLAGNYNQLEVDYNELEEQYLRIRGDYIKLKAGNTELAKSNETSLELIRRCREILRSLQED